MLALLVETKGLTNKHCWVIVTLRRLSDGNTGKKLLLRELLLSCVDVRGPLVEQHSQEDIVIETHEH